jgi:hypothetical protein
VKFNLRKKIKRERVWKRETERRIYIYIYIDRERVRETRENRGRGRELDEPSLLETHLKLYFSFTLNYLFLRACVPNKCSKCNKITHTIRYYAEGNIKNE